MKWLGFNKQRFTLVEMLAVLVIMIIIASLVVPAIGKMMGGQGVDGAAAMLQSKLRAVRAYAVANRKTVGIFIPVDAGMAAENLTKMRPVVLNSTGDGKAAWWEFAPDTKWDFFPLGAALEAVYKTTPTPNWKVQCVYDNLGQPMLLNNLPGYMVPTPATSVVQAELVSVVKTPPAAAVATYTSAAHPLPLLTDLNGDGTSDLTYYDNNASPVKGIVIGFKSNGQPIVGRLGAAFGGTDLQQGNVAFVSGISLRIAKGKVSEAGIFTPNKQPGDFETLDYSTLVIDRYTGQTKIYPNK